MVTHRLLRSSIVIVITLALFSACNSIPDHARYIPKDAAMVAGVNLKGLGKKIAWNVITGSKLYKEMEAKVPEKSTKDAMSDIEKSGIDFANTFYIYSKPDNRYSGGQKVVGLLPLSSADAWETYIKKTFPQAAIKQNGDRKEVSLEDKLYIGWDKHLMIILNTVTAEADSVGGKEITPEGKNAVAQHEAAAEMDVAFKTSADNSMTGNKHFATLEKEGHDISLFINYEQLMGQMSESIAEKMSMALSDKLWKDAAFSSGFDFVKGKITADMHYYVSEELKEIGVELGADNADKDMIDRLHVQNLNMLAAVHLAPKGIKDILEKMNLLGLANLGLSAQGSSVEGVLNAFTGDMAFMMNDFSLKTENVTDSLMGEKVVRQNQVPSFTMTYVLKINKKDNFRKLVKMAEELGLQKNGDGYVVKIDDKNSVYIMMNDQYVIASNKYDNAKGFLAGSFKAEKKPEAVSSIVMGHPWAFYFDVQQFCKNVSPDIYGSGKDSLMISESKKLLSDISLTGGGFKNNAFEYHLDISFLNKEENSILALMDYCMRMNDANKAEWNK